MFLNNNIKFLLTTLFITTIGYSQNLVPGGVDAGEDFTLDCTSGPCTTLSAEFHHSHETDSRYTVSSIPMDPVAVSLPSSINQDDQFSPIIDLPFEFCYFGNNSNQIVIGDNGNISFDTSLANAFDPWQFSADIPSPSLPSGGIFGAYHDLYIIEGGAITYGVTGTEPFRAFVINYKSVAQYSSAYGCNDPTTQQIVLHETSGFIDVYITEKPACTGWENGRAALGIQNIGGTEGYFAPGRNTSDSPWSATNEAWRFAPTETGPETFTFEWVNNTTGAVISNMPDFEVCPTENTTYTSNVTWIDCVGNTVSASDEVTITVDLPFSMEILGGDQDFCLGDPDYTINSTTTVLGSVTITGYNWYEISDPATSLGTTDALTVNSTGTYVLEVTDSGGCVLSEQVVVNYNPVPDAGTDGAISFCSTDVITDLFVSIGGTPDTGGIWSPALTSGTGIFDPAVDVGGIYSYTVAASGSCTDVIATVTVTLDIAPNAGADSTKAYCSIDAASDLFLELGGAPDTGGIWSPALISGTGVFDPAVDLVGVYTYTVVATGLCIDASATITVSVDIAPEAGTNSSINYCSTDAPTDLFLELGGTPDIGGVWSPSLTSGTGVFDPAVDTENTYTYIVTGGGCPDATSEVVVTIDTAPNAGTDATADFCTDNATADLFDSLGGTPDIGGIWTPALISGTGVFDPAVDTGGIYTYTVSPIGACLVDATATITVTLNTAPEAGTNGTMAYCSTDAATDLFLNLGGTPDVGGTWSPALASGTGFFNPTVDLAGTYTYTVAGTGVCIDDNAIVTVYIDIAPDAGIDNTADFCTDNAAADLFANLGGTPDTGGVWSPALTSGSGIFDPTVDTAGIYTYTVAPTGACFVNTIATITVTVDTAPEAGIDSTKAYCSIDSASDLFSELGGTPDTGGTWSPVLTSGAGIFDPTVDVAGIYTYTVAGTGVCVDDNAIVTVYIDIAPDAGIDGTADFCTDNAAADLFANLGGTPDSGGTWSPALTSGTGYFDPAIDLAGIYTYTVSPVGACFVAATATVTVTVDTAPEAGIDGAMAYCSTDLATDLFANLGGTPDMGGIWSPALTSGTGMFNPALDVAGIYIYTVAGVGVCTDNSAIVTVTVDIAPDAGLDGVSEFCTSDATVDLITFLGGTPDTTGIWSPALTSGTGVFDPLVDITGIYTYTVSNGVCTDATATVNVTVYTAANAGTDDAITLCSNSSSVDLYTFLGGAPDLGGTWSPALSSGTGFFDPAIDVAGIYTYTIIGTGVCVDDTAAITVSIDAEPNAGTDNTIEFCSTDATLDLFMILGGTPNVTGVWSPALNSGTGVFDPATDTEGIYTYTVSNGVCIDATSEVEVTLFQAPNAGTNGTADFCTSDLGDDLFKYLGDTPDAIGTWSPLLTSGTGLFDPAVDLGGTYIYTVLGTGTCTDSFAAVDVTVSSAPDAGLDADAFFCMSEPSLDLHTLLGGTPDNGGTWSPSLASGTGVFDPATDAAGDYTYTVFGLGACQDISAIISVNLSEASRITNVDISDFSDNNTITVEVEGAISGTSFGIGDYEYSLDGVSFQSENIIQGIAPGDYVLTVRDANGCFPPAYRNISIIGAGQYFTPNNDGHNDTWNIINLTQEILVNPSDGVSIFDRYGKMIVTLNANSIIGWDGYYNGNPLPSGDYWYSVLVKDANDNPVLKRGHFSLVRR